MNYYICIQDGDIKAYKSKDTIVSIMSKVDLSRDHHIFEITKGSHGCDSVDLVDINMIMYYPRKNFVGVVVMFADDHNVLLEELHGSKIIEVDCRKLLYVCTEDELYQCAG